MKYSTARVETESSIKKLDPQSNRQRIVAKCCSAGCCFGAGGGERRKERGLIERRRRGRARDADGLGADECLADITSDVVAANREAKPHWLSKE